VVERGSAEFSSIAEMRGTFLASAEFRAIAIAIVAASDAPWVFREIEAGVFLPLDLTDIGVSLPILQNGTWEEDTTRFILSRVHPGTVFLDVGANIGWFSLQVAARLRQLGEDGTVIAIEAQHEVVGQLRKAIAISGLDDFICLQAVAAGEMHGKATLHRLTDGNRGGTYVLPTGQTINPTDSVEESIRVEPLDMLLSDLRRLDLVKLDVEGSEIAVIRGAVGLLRKFRPELIVEINEEALQRTAGLGAEQLLAELSECGYICVGTCTDIETHQPLEVAQIISIVHQQRYPNFLFRPI
jgi:FkbM family methyltransferase